MAHKISPHHDTLIFNETQINYCLDCGFYHQSPLPKATEVWKRYFEDEPYADEWLEKETEEHKRGWWTSSYDYQRGLMGNPCYLLDFGSGAGWFVNHLNKTPVIDAYGVEPSTKAITKAFQTEQEYFGVIPNPIAPTFTENLHDIREGVMAVHGRFQAIRASLVFEHLQDPYADLVNLRDFLQRDGVIQVIVPNEFNPLQRKVGGYWWISRDHINYFDSHSLKSLMERANFRIVDMTATFPTELWIRLGLDHRKHPKLGDMTHRWRLRMEQIAPNFMFDLYRTWFKKHGWGRELIYTGRKKK